MKLGKDFVDEVKQQPIHGMCRKIFESGNCCYVRGNLCDGWRTLADSLRVETIALIVYNHELFCRFNTGKVCCLWAKPYLEDASYSIPHSLSPIDRFILHL